MTCSDRDQQECKKSVKQLPSQMVDIPGAHLKLCKYTVTQALWMAVMGENPSYFKGANRPVEIVSWNDCQVFIKKLNEMPEVVLSRLVYRLPTAEEWRCACLSGSKGAYCELADGTEITEETLGQVAWYKDNSGNATHPVGQKEPNKFGLYDMHGNVCEWTATVESETRVIRGGCWLSNATHCTAGCRFRLSLEQRDNDVGFRLAAETPEMTADRVAEEAKARAEIEAAAAMAAEEAAHKEAEKAAEEARAALMLRMKAETRKCELEQLRTQMVDIPGTTITLCKYAVTQLLWVVVMGENPSHFKGADRPVENVSWDACQEFIKRLNAMPEVVASGQTYRLPTEEDWEYACRAESDGDYCKLADGIEIRDATLGQVAWYRNNSGDETHPVGQKAPNKFGLYDMHGNVWEWTATTKAGKCVIRGGSYQELAGACRADYVSLIAQNFRCDDIGFRLAAVKTTQKTLGSKALEERNLSLIANLQFQMVEIPNAYVKLCKYTVTQALWEAVMGTNPSYFKGADRPVEHVSPADCQAFIKKLNATPIVKASGLKYRLPTAEEWKCACRAESKGGYCQLADGTEIVDWRLGQVAWYKDNSGDETHPVGRKEPNKFGLYDMHGNVWEWTATEEYGERIFAGGSWDDCAFDCTAYACGSCRPYARHGNIGFRLAAETPEMKMAREVAKARMAAERKAAEAKAERDEKAKREAIVEREALRAKEERAMAEEAKVRKMTRETVLAQLQSQMVDIPGSGFMLCKYEVRQALWKAVMGENPSYFKGANRPVENVSWNESQSFIQALNAMPEVVASGLVYRLPTEEEWEFACRAGSNGDYCKLAGGTEITKKTLGQVAWHKDNSGDEPHPTRQKKPNEFGLYDMLGNVWEWTATDKNGKYVCRGGSYSDRSNSCTAKAQKCFAPDDRHHGLGFRLAADAR